MIQLKIGGGGGAAARALVNAFKGVRRKTQISVGTVLITTRQHSYFIINKYYLIYKINDNNEHDAFLCKRARTTRRAVRRGGDAVALHKSENKAGEEPQSSATGRRPIEQRMNERKFKKFKKKLKTLKRESPACTLFIFS